MNNSQFIIIIPARKNSKRLKGKNTKILNGKPLISYSIEFAIKYFNKNQIWLNTDDEKVEEIGAAFGLNIYKRKKNLGNDNTPIGEVILDQIIYLEQQRINFNNIILLQPTNPFRDNLDLDKIMSYYISNQLNSLMTVSSTKMKLGSIANDFFTPLNYNYEQRSQSLNNLYFENGQLYISNKNIIKKNKNLISKDVFPFITKGIQSKIDIDIQEDFDFAEYILNKSEK